MIEISGVAKAIAYQAEPDSGTKFKLKNVSVDWEHVNNTHPPLLDLFLSNGHFEIDHVNVTSYSSYDAVTASIEVEANTESKKVNPAVTQRCFNVHLTFSTYI